MARERNGCAALAGLLFFGLGFFVGMATLNPVLMLGSLFMVCISCAAFATPAKKRRKASKIPPSRQSIAPTSDSFLDSLSDRALNILNVYGAEAYYNLYLILVLSNREKYSRKDVYEEIQRLSSSARAIKDDEYLNNISHKSRAVIKYLGPESVIWMLEHVQRAFPELSYTTTQGTPKSRDNRLSKEGDLHNVISRLSVNKSLAIEDLIPKESKPAEETALEQVLKELNQLVGIQSAKDSFQQIIATRKIDLLREKSGVRVAKRSLSVVLLGPPGTGKTVIARLYGRALAAIGCLSRGHFIEVSRSDLIGQYLGETATKTRLVLESALGGVLFIDEAYSIMDENSGENVNAYGRECIAEMIKIMEDSRDNICIILAGYAKEMSAFLAANPGLASRFPDRIYFNAYTDKELERILVVMMNDYGWSHPSSEVINKALGYLASVKASNADSFGNAREVRNLIDKIYKNQSVRLARSSSGVSPDELKQIQPSDVPMS